MMGGGSHVLYGEWPTNSDWQSRETSKASTSHDSDCVAVLL